MTFPCDCLVIDQQRSRKVNQAMKALPVFPERPD
jgi:hypothetical protein